MTFKPKSPSTRPSPPTLKDALAEARAVTGAGVARPASSAPTSLASSGRKTIVVASMRLRLRTALEAYYGVAEAKDGMEAAELAGKMTTPAMFVCDVVMPRVDGFTLAKILKSNPVMKRVPIMFLSSRNSPQDVTQALVLGACQYVLKTVPMGEIVANIRKIVA